MLTAGQHLFLTRRVRGPDFDGRPVFFRPFFPMLQCSIWPICLVITGHMTCKRARAGMQTLRFAARSGLRSRHGRIMTRARRRPHAHPHPPTRARTDAIHHSIHPHPPVNSQQNFRLPGPHPHPGKLELTHPLRILCILNLKFPRYGFAGWR